MNSEILDKYADIFFEGIRDKLSKHLIEGREIYFSPDDIYGMKKVLRGWLTEFYNEANG
jgi:hypothetical protein